MRKVYSSLLLTLSLSIGLRAQEVTICGTDMSALPKSALPVYQTPTDAPLNDDTLIIPVVFHVFHEFGQENVSREQLQVSLDLVNDFYNNPEVDQIVDEFQGIVGQANIEFRMARLDPNGNPTDGVTRHFSPLTDGEEAASSAGLTADLLNTVRWNAQRYINIYVVRNIRSIDGGGVVAGYVSYLGGRPALAVFRERSLFDNTLAHELGHYLMLPHPWGRTNSPGPDRGNCDTDDGIDDTPLTEGVFPISSCNLNQTTCGSLDNVQNVMDYARCGIMFTAGQVQAMRDGLLNTPDVGPFNTLVTPSNLVATGTNNGYVPTEGAPIIDAFRTDRDEICAPEGVGLDVSVYNAPDSTLEYKWIVPGASVDTILTKEAIPFYEQAGLFPITLIVSNSAGSDTLVQEATLRVRNPLIYSYAIPFVEDFETTIFNRSEQYDSNWVITTSTIGSRTWELTTDAALDGSTSLVLDNRQIVNDIEHELISPVIDFTMTTETPLISFYVAYASNGDDLDEVFEVATSVNCGRSWSRRARLRPGDLESAPEQVSGVFVPADETQWKRHEVRLSGTAGRYAQVRILVESQRGNRIYLDSLQVGSNLVTSVNEAVLSADLKVFPNPTQGTAEVSYRLPAADETTLRVVDVLGRTIWQEEPRRRAAGEYQTTLPALPSGFYLVRLRTADGEQTRRLVVQ
ncbi:MAG: zinc-dependent metalloprotease [Catalinimonas sp.]